jgi:hypothetical protein
VKSGKEIQKGIVNFINSMATDRVGYYRYSVDCPPTMYGSAFAGLALALSGQLEDLDDATRAAWIDYLQGCQDEKTGWFVSPEFRSEDRISAKHSDELLFAHSSTFVMVLLHYLGARPRYPLKWIHPYRERNAMRKWIESLGWEKNAWVVGNWTYDMGCAIGMDYLVTGDEACMEQADHYFNWFDEHQRDDTGWWDLKTGGSELFEQQFGGYHTLMVYWMFDRPIAKGDRIIDSSLKLQTADGMFEPAGGGGCCQDMDCIDPLVQMGMATDYRRADIAGALEKALVPILAKQADGTGFYDALTWIRSEFGWQLCKAEPGHPDACSNWFYPFSVALAGEFLGDKDILDAGWQHHTTYGHCVKRTPVVK